MFLVEHCMFLGIVYYVFYGIVLCFSTSLVKGNDPFPSFSSEWIVTLG